TVRSQRALQSLGRNGDLRSGRAARSGNLRRAPVDCSASACVRFVSSPPIELSRLLGRIGQVEARIGFAIGGTAFANSRFETWIVRRQGLKREFLQLAGKFGFRLVRRFI